MPSVGLQVVGSEGRQAPGEPDGAGSVGTFFVSSFSSYMPDEHITCAFLLIIVLSHG